MRKKQSEFGSDVSVNDLFDELLVRLTLIGADEKEESRRKESQDNKRRKLSERLMQGMASKEALCDAWQMWSDNPKKRNPSLRTELGYKTQWKRFKSWLAEKYPHFKHLHEVTPTIAEEYATELWASGLSPGTYNSHIKFLKSMFKVLTVRAGLSINPWSDIPAMEKEQESKRNLEPDELQTVCSSATGSLRFWLAIGLYTGLRLGDVVTLKWNEVQLGKGVIERVPMKTKRKNKKVRFPIHDVLHAMLLELKEQSPSKTEYLFSQDVKLYERDPSAVSKIVAKHLKACSIETTEEPSNGHRKRRIVRVGFHSLRHSFVSLCAANRVPQVAIMELVGHGSPAMTALYSHAGDEQKAKAIAALPEVSFDNGESP